MPSDLTVGRKLLHYEILAPLGAGGMGEVWRAYDARLDREVALKVLPQAAGDMSLARERLLREARAASALIHPNIITVHEINSAEGMDFIVMELVRGESLSSILSRGRLSVRQSLDYAIQVAQALKTAHAASVVHRDLKPGNIMIAASGLVKVLDFGIAKRITSAAAADVTSAALTMAGAPIGTPAYMSPEQALGDPVDARSDLFALGVVLYQMLSGVLPFSGTTTSSVVRQIVHDPPQPLRQFVPDVPDTVAAIVDRCLAKDPDARYPQASAVLRDLENAALRLDRAPATGADLPTETSLSAPAVARPRPRRSGLRAGAALLVVVAGLLGYWLTTRRAALPDAAAAVVGSSPGALHDRATERLRLYYREGNVDTAIAELEEALRRRSPYPLAEARLSLAYWRRNSTNPDPRWQQQALAYADRAVAGDPQLAVAHVAHGAALSLAGQFDQAAAAFDRAFTLDPSNWDLLWRMGDLAVARKDLKTAEDLYRRSVAAAPAEWEPYARLGGFLYRQSRYDEALAAFDTMRQLAGDHARSHTNVAAVLHQLDRTDEAARALQRALEIAPDHMTYSNLGTLLFFQGKYPESLSAFERAVALGANEYRRWGNLADAARLTPGGRDKAHQGYTRAVQLARERLAKDPADVDARSSVAVYLVRDGQPGPALAELDRVLEHPKPAPAVLFKAAIVAELAGQRRRALDLLGRALGGGYTLREIRQEPDLVQLRADPEYHKLVMPYDR